MKIAFVSQPIDHVLPPYQNSVGACTYGSACSLAREHQVVVYGLQPDGEERSRVTERGVEYRFLEGTRGDVYLDKARTRLSRVLPLEPASSSKWFFPDYGRQVARTLSQEQFDIIHIQHSCQYAPIIRKWNPNAKIVIHLHAEWFSQSKSHKLLVRASDADMISGVSDYVVERVHQLVPELKKPCVTHYNGFDPTEFAFDKDYAANSKDRPVRILFAGGISPHKGIHVLMDAFNRVASEVENVRLTLSGPAGTYPFEETFDRSDRQLHAELASFYSPEASLLQKLLNSGSSFVPDYVSQVKARLKPEVLDRVEFVGKIPRDQLVRLYYEADIFVFPSLFAEGFGLPPVEAMAAGTVVIGSRSGAISETIEDGVTGLLVEKNNVGALADALIYLCRDSELREKLGRAGKKRAMQKFTWDEVTVTMARNYEMLCSGQPSTVGRQ